MPSHEAFIKSIRMEPNEPFHEVIYGDFLRDEGYDPPDEFIRRARALAPLLHSAAREFRMPNRALIGAFGLEVLLSCTHLYRMRELHLMGYVSYERVVEERRSRYVPRVVPNVAPIAAIADATSATIAGRLRIRDASIRREGSVRWGAVRCSSGRVVSVVSVVMMSPR